MKYFANPVRFFILLVLLSFWEPRGHASDSPPARIAADAFAILNRACFECHGKDRQDGGLRLDSRQAIIDGGDSGPVVAEQDAASSELLRRIALPKGHGEVMPKRGDVLTQREIATLRSWLSAGFPWSEAAAQQKHWSYVAPIKSPMPVGSAANANPIDAFVTHRLQQEGRNLSPVAVPRVLVRRLYLDVLGIPPTVEQTERFVAQASIGIDQAVTDLVDELLASPQYGDKWARPWLDAARYADSHGFQRDDLHEIWAYRDWVIRALNADMPFDQFTIEQLAGDLIPNATESQRIATGFNRCSPCNVEAGTDPEENRFNQIVDRVNTLGYAWLGSSLECAQCHDHKYDPFTQRDYYGLFAFFNQTELEADRTNPKVPGSIQFKGPYLELEDLQAKEQRAELESQIRVAKERLQAVSQRLAKSNSSKRSADQLIVLRPTEFESLEGASHEFLEDGSVLLRGDAPDTDTYTVVVPLTGSDNIEGILLETLTDDSLPGGGPGRGDTERPNFVLNSFQVEPIYSEKVASPGSIALVDAQADFSQANFAPAGAADSNEKSAWAVSPQFGKDHWAAFRFEETKSLVGATHLRVRLIQNFGGSRTIGRLRLSAIAGDYAKALQKTNVEDPRVAKLRKQVASLESKRNSIGKAKTLVMKEIDEPRMSTMYARGDVRSPGDAVEPSTPVALHPYQFDGPKNRLGLARWLVSPENPLVGRVLVNRMWNEIFGSGLVATPEDFGLKGEAPSHPEVLDWLAADFVENGWSQKRILRTILNSHTYRQTSSIDSHQLREDPNNVLLGRGPRFRLPAESIRDNALAIAGLLSLKQYGPPIRPPQPDGLWKKVGGQAYDYQVSEGEDKYRRGIYVVLKRMSPYPSFTTFDATARLACRVKRTRSNTPLQALTLLNDPVYVEAALAFAAHITERAPSEAVDGKLIYAFQRAVSRQPSAEELQLLTQLFQHERDAHAPAPDADTKAWYAVATTLLNLDETITKE